MKTDEKDPHQRIILLQEKIMRQRSELKSKQLRILELQARVNKLAPPVCKCAWCAWERQLRIDETDRMAKNQIAAGENTSKSMRSEDELASNINNLPMAIGPGASEAAYQDEMRRA